MGFISIIALVAVVAISFHLGMTFYPVWQAMREDESFAAALGDRDNGNNEKANGDNI